MLRERIMDFLEHESDLLDSRRFEEWLALFDPDAWYWIPLSPDQKSWTDGPSHVFEARPVLAARVERLMAARMIPQSPPSRTSRIIGALRVETNDPIGVRCRFHVAEARVLHEPDDEAEQRLFAGEAKYGLREHGDSFRIAWKRVDLINSEAGLRGVSVLL
jgi:3-phenylpropionate/cinnamic acid dioxygenase small subunit